MILFLRRIQNISEPFFTVEVRDRRVVQVRGWDNGAPTPEVQKFISQWERRRLQTVHNTPAA